jgi:LTXXQ motif family protein
MFKSMIAATAVIAIAGSSVVYAQQGHWGPRAERHQHHHVNAADMAAFTDARIAALKAGLELTTAQQQNWPAFEQALRGVAQLRTQAAAARHPQGQETGTAPQQNAQQQPQTARDPFDRLAKRADTMAKMSAALQKVAEAGRPLYQSLTDTQKARFKTLSRMLRPHPRRVAFNERGRHGGRGFGGGEHRGFAPNGGGGSGSQL